jgi:hypothetical protein
VSNWASYISLHPCSWALLYNTSEPGFKTSNFVVSSYILTLTALLEPPLTRQQTFQELLGVSQPCNPKQSLFANAAKELIQIEELGSNLHTHSLLGELTTVDSVLKDMNTTSGSILPVMLFKILLKLPRAFRIIV